MAARAKGRIVRRTRTLSVAAVAAALLMASAQASWQDDASQADIVRLGKLAESKAKGLAEAENGAQERDLAVIHGVLDTPPVTLSATQLSGRWRCRTIKLGGMTPDVIYSWFACRIAEHDGKLSFEKASGSQRTRGALYPDASGGFVYLGASSVKGEPVHSYSGSGASAGAASTPDDQIGLLVGTGTKSARIEFPYPAQESTFDIIELKR